MIHNLPNELIIKILNNIFSLENILNIKNTNSNLLRIYKNELKYRVEYIIYYNKFYNSIVNSCSIIKTYILNITNK